MTRYAWGSLAATDLQEIAQAAAASGACHEDIFALASLGAHGEQPGNCHRDLMRTYFSGLATPEPFSLAVPLSVKDSVTGHETIQKTSIDIILPHDWVSCMDGMAGKHLLHELLNISDCKAFWNMQDFANNPQIVQAAEYFKSVKHAPESNVPLLLHGDGVPHTTTDSLLVISMRSLLSKRSVKDSQLLLVCLPKGCLVENSLVEVWQVLVWSLHFHRASILMKITRGRSMQAWPIELLHRKPGTDWLGSHWG